RVAMFKAGLTATGESIHRSLPASEFFHRRRIYSLAGKLLQRLKNRVHVPPLRRGEALGGVFLAQRRHPPWAVNAGVFHHRRHRIELTETAQHTQRRSSELALASAMIFQRQTGVDPAVVDGFLAIMTGLLERW